VGRVRTFGASITGKRHQLQRKPNDDAWLSGSGHFGSFVCVADGVGSARNARKGAKEACNAVRAVVGMAHVALGDVCSTLQDFAKHIETTWADLIRPDQPEECATTCLVAWHKRDGSLLVGGIGDGMIIARVDGETRWVVGPPHDKFNASTSTLGQGCRWAGFEISAPSTFQILLATDGVADDTRPEKINEFIDWLMAEIGTLDTAGRRSKLRNALWNWPTPGSDDDRTLSVLHGVLRRSA